MVPNRLRKIARGVSLLGAIAGIAVGLPAAANADVVLKWEPSASLFWTNNESALMSLFQNGQCTELAANKRPDVVKAIVLNAISSELNSGQAEVVPNLDARYWSSEAGRAGISTGQTPRVGSLMVFQPGVLWAGSAGHIAYVQSVHGNSFTVSQMNAPIPYRVTSQTFRMSVGHRRGIRFIY